MRSICLRNPVSCRGAGWNGVSRTPRFKAYLTRTDVAHQLRFRHCAASSSRGDFDSVFGSPFDFVEQEMQQLRASSPFDTFEKELQDMQRQMSDMERQMDADMSRSMRQMDADMSRSMRQAQEEASAALKREGVFGPAPEVSFRREQEVTGSSYRYYQHIEIHSGYSTGYRVPVQSTIASGPSTLLLAAAAILAGSYAAVVAAFNKNYKLTTFKQESKWKLLLLWPVLLLFSRNFRQQLGSALRGERVTVGKDKE